MSSVNKSILPFLMFILATLSLSSVLANNAGTIILVKPKLRLVNNNLLVYNITLVSFNNEPLNVSVYITLKSRSNETIERYNITCKLPPQTTYTLSGSLSLPETLSPNVYFINISYLSQVINKSFLLRVYLPPSLEDYKMFLKDITSLRMIVEEKGESLRLMFPLDFQEKITMLQKTYQLSLKAYTNNDPVNATLLFSKAKSIYLDLKHSYTSSIAKIPFEYVYLKNLDDSLFLDPQLILTFWTRIIITTAFFPVIIFLFLPLYITKLDIWLENISQASEELEKDIKLYESIIGQRVVSLLSISKSYVVSSLRFYLLLIIAAFISTIGLLTDNLITIIGSMLVSPILSISVGTSIGLALRDEKVDNVTGSSIFWTGMKNEVCMIILTILTSFFTTQIVSIVYPIIPTEQLLLRSRPNLSDLGIAIGAGLAGALALLGSKREVSVVVGAAIAIALIPPASTIGIGLVMRRPDITLGSLTLLVINVIALTLSVYLAVRIYLLEAVLSRFFKAFALELKESIQKFDPRLFINTLTDFLISWINIILNISPLEEKNDSEDALSYVIPYIKQITFLLIEYVITPILFVFSFGFIMSTNLFYPLTLLFRTLDLALSNFINKRYILKSYANVILYIGVILAVVWLVYSYKVLRRKNTLRRSIGYILYSVLLWIFFEYIYDIYLFSRTHTVFFLSYFSLISIILYWGKIKNKAKAIAVGFTLFSLLFTTLQSAYVYQSLVYSQKLVNVSSIARYVTATYLNINSSKIIVESKLVGTKPLVKIGIEVPATLIDKFMLKEEDIIILSQSIREMTGWSDLSIDFYYILTPT